MATYTAARGTAVIKPEFATSPVFTDTNAHFAGMWDYLSQFLVSYNHTWDPATRQWHGEWEFIDINKVISELIALQNIYDIEWLESIVSLEVYDGKRWRRVNVNNNRLTML